MYAHFSLSHRSYSNHRAKVQVCKNDIHKYVGPAGYEWDSVFGGRCMRYNMRYAHCTQRDAVTQQIRKCSSLQYVGGKHGSQFLFLLCHFKRNTIASLLNHICCIRWALQEHKIKFSGFSAAHVTQNLFLDQKERLAKNCGE